MKQPPDLATKTEQSTKRPDRERALEMQPEMIDLQNQTLQEFEGAKCNNTVLLIAIVKGEWTND